MESLDTKKRGRPIKICTIKNILNVGEDSISKNTETYKKSITEELAELKEKELLKYKLPTREELYDKIFNNKLQPLPIPPTKEELLKYSVKLDLEPCSDTHANKNCLIKMAS